MRILVIGDGRWAADSLMPLINAGHEIAGVVLRNEPSDDSLGSAARGLEIKVLKPENVNTPDFVNVVTDMGVDLGLSIACNQIMKTPLLNAPLRGFVNFHAGKLPKYRGRNIINWAIINGETEIGLTAHVVDTGIDTGDILLQRSLPIEWTDNYGDVLERIIANFPEFVVEAVAGVELGTSGRRPQVRSAGTYFCGRVEGDEWLDWSASSLDIYNKIRGIGRPGPGARTVVGDATVNIWKATYNTNWPKYIATSGQVVGRGEDGVVVKTGDSTILIREVDVDGGPCELPSWPIGTRLGIDLFRLVESLRSRIGELERQVLVGKNAGNI